MLKQLDILFSNYDLAFNPKDGVVVTMKEYQKGCHGVVSKNIQNKKGSNRKTVKPFLKTGTGGET
ncbi:MAG: hypothetical protein GY710_00800 [Desulfobacteraceae bacterium]|nr:hypothetical protein [Desulfobacteraceae bacterium]